MTKAKAPHRKSSPITNKEAAIKHSRKSRRHASISDRRRVFSPANLPDPEKDQAKIKTPPPLARQTQTVTGVHKVDRSTYRLDFPAAPPSSSVDICRTVLMPPTSFQHLSRSFPGRVASEFLPWSAMPNSFVDIASIVDQVTTPHHHGVHSISATNGQPILTAAHFPRTATFQDSNMLTCASLPFLEKQADSQLSTECKSLKRNSNGASNHQSIANCERWANLIQTIPQTGMMCLACPEDRGMLNEHLIFVRQQIEFFQASVDDIMSYTRGRSKSIAPLQVGIRCRHCSHIPAGQRTKGSTYFPSTLMGIYQAAQNISVEHLQSGVCLEMPDEVKIGISTTKAAKTAASGIGKAYWAESARTQGFVDTEDGIRYGGDSATSLLSSPLAVLH